MDEDSTSINRVSRQASSDSFTLGDARRFSYVFALSQFLLLVVVAAAATWMAHFGGGLGTAGAANMLRFHPLLMIVGFVFCQGEALLAYRLMRHARKVFAKTVHAALHTLTLGAFVGGAFAVVDAKTRLGAPSMYSLHSWIGTLVGLLFLLQYVVGMLAFVLVRGGTRVELMRRDVLPVHRAAGLAIFVLAVGQCLLGVVQFPLVTRLACYPQLCAEGLVINTLGLSVLAFGATVVYLLTCERFRRRPIDSDAAPYTQID